MYYLLKILTTYVKFKNKENVLVKKSKIVPNI